MTVTVPLIPEPVPLSTDSANFDARADAHVAALPEMVRKQNEQNIENNAINANVNAQVAAAVQATGVTKWLAGTAYSEGVSRYDPVTYLTYRRKAGSPSAIRPALDPTNWQLLAGLGDVDLVSDQVITGAKTFSKPITGSVTGSAASITGVNPVANGGTGLADGSNLLPPGIVGTFARNTAPAGWLKANGAAVSRTTYAALFAAIGTTFGVGDGSTTFGLPDLRGEFVRGWDDGRGVDSGRAFGSGQSDEIKSHSHAVNANNAGGRFTSTGDSGVYASGYSAVTASTGGAETRPRNIALLACIKY